MTKIEIVSFVQSEFIASKDFISVIDFLELKDSSKYFDVAIFDETSSLECNEFCNFCVNKDIFKIIIVEDDNDLDKYKQLANAWILKSSVSQLFDFCGNIKDELILKKELFFAQLGLQKAFVSNFVNLESISMIKDEISDSTKKLSLSFENRVNELREIDSNIGAIKFHLKKYKDNKDNLDLIEKSIDKTEQVSSDLSKSIEELVKHVQILQCEDKIFQLFDGIINIIKDVDENLENSNLCIDEAKKSELMKKLVDFYSIQEQRDFVLNKKDEQSVSFGELTLF
jgi:hypothetical protein